VEEQLDDLLEFIAIALSLADDDYLVKQEQVPGPDNTLEHQHGPTSWVTVLHYAGRAAPAQCQPAVTEATE
jgi:hypothetical protein